MTPSTEVAIIGAGPYGLSLGAHLAAAGVNFRIFGKPLSTWRGHMPKGMLLKSDGFASNLAAPDPASTLAAYCAERGIEYDDRYIPVPLALFTEYSAWFQKRYVPMLEEENVVSLSAMPGGYSLTLENGEMLTAAKVVLAVGITHFSKMPELLEGLRGPRVSHSFDHHDVAALAGRDVLVLGAGSSAVDTAVLAADAGANVTLLARRNVIHYHSVPDPDAVSWLTAITHPSSGIGPGWRSFLCSNAPRLFRRLPEPLRLTATKKHLGPAPGWFMRGKLEGRVKTRLGYEIVDARVDQDQVTITAQNASGERIALETDHVIAATGYKSDLRRLTFIAEDLRGRISHVEHTPNLSDNFETSVPGLYVAGPMAANAFGPLMRFMVGSEYVAPRLGAHLAKTVQRKARAA